MNGPNAILSKLAALKNLPTLPHILLKLIEACNNDNPDLNAIGAIVNTDPVLSAKILKLVNSAHMGLRRKVEAVTQAVMLLGTTGIKNIAICAAVYEAFASPKTGGRFDLKQFWWHSLRCACLAKHMASDWNGCHPDEAFLAGLLHDIGKALLWIHFRKSYDALLESSGHDKGLMLAGEARLGATHAEVGAWLLDRWQLGSSISDCVRYHHETPDRIAQAFPLVQTIHAANLLCQDTEDGLRRGLASVNQLLGRDPLQCHRLVAKSDQEARAVARWLDIDIDSILTSDGQSDDEDRAVQDRLTGDVRHLALTVGTLESFLAAEGQGSILKCIADAFQILFDTQRSLFFLMDETRDALVGHMLDPAGGGYVKHPRLTVSMKMTATLLVRALVEQHPLDSVGTGSDGLTVIDEQLKRLLGGAALCCLPLIAHNHPIGVLALGVPNDRLPHRSENTGLLNLLLHQGASALHLEDLRRRQLQRVQATRIEASIDLARRVVHEVNNPLGIIKNYLKVLGMKMAAAGMEDRETQIISQEISRISRLLKKLTAFSTPESPGEARTDLNALLLDLLALTQAPLLSDANISIHSDLEPNLPKVVIDPDNLKQVLINLIRNAADAISPRGGRIEIRARHLAPPLGDAPSRGANAAGGQIEVVIRDDGPGIPQAVREKLFDPYVSTKGGAHSGLGLAIVYHIIQSFHGSIVCESAPDHGTAFTIVLPAEKISTTPSGEAPR